MPKRAARSQHRLGSRHRPIARTLSAPCLRRKSDVELLAPRLSQASGRRA